MPHKPKKPKPEAGTNQETLDRVRNAADEKAVAAGMRFDVGRAAFVVDWIEGYCRLYEGEKAGQPLILLPEWRKFFEHLYGWVFASTDWNAWIRRFNKAAFWSAKKAGKSPCAAAHNLYMLCGDGEQGQKVYAAAANGEQAKIVMRHAINMVLQSPELAEDCKVNNTTMAIQHRPTNSLLEILTGDDTRGAKSKEGINGSVTYDEMHVVNREVEERTSRAGISRREPINCSFSTAGDDPSSVGFERYQYGEQVNKGERDDVRFLHVDYSPPKNLSDADLDGNILKFGAMANPTWGTLVKPGEFAEDWERSKGRTREVARFKQYRLNLWVGSTNPWLDSFGWEKGADHFNLADLRGRDCFSALDLSRTRDMTAFVMVFPWPEEGPEVVRIWPMFWMPEQTAKDRDHLYPFQSWARSGHLTLTSGGVVDYSLVKADIRKVVREFSLNLLGLYYDPHYAEEITQQLKEGEQIGTSVEPGLGCERILFKQSLMYFTGPSKEMERRVSAGLVRHSGNPVMTWQVGHAQVWSDRNNNIRPVKPEPHSGKCVDGVVAAAMTFLGIMNPTDDTISSHLLVL